MDFWDGPITLDRSGHDKIKWKKRYLVMQTSPHSFIHLLMYRKKKTTDVPVLNFTLSDETSMLCFGPTYRNKFTFDVSVRIGRLFMRYRFGVEAEDSRNRWLHELVTSYFVQPHTPLSKWAIIVYLSRKGGIKEFDTRNEIQDDRKSLRIRRESIFS